MLAKYAITTPFVDVFAVARAEGFEVRVKPLPDGLSGRLVGKVIEVNAGEAAVRQRFTVAHELGPFEAYVLPGGVDCPCSNALPCDVRERVSLH